MTESYEVKGSSILSKLEYLRKVHGTEAAEKVEAPLKKKGLMPFLTSSWYPYSIYVGVNEVIANELFGGNLAGLQEVGAYSAEKSLLGTYKMLAQNNDYFGLLGELAILHGRFYNIGTLKVEVAEDRSSCRIMLSGAPAYAEADIQVAAGFYIKAAELTDRPDARIAIERQPDAVAFDVSW